MCNIGFSGNPTAIPLRPTATRTEPNVCPRSASSRSAFSMCCGDSPSADIEASLEALQFSELELREARRLASGARARHAVELELAELDPADLPCQRLRQLGYEFNAARVRVCGEALADVALDLVG